MSEFTWDFNDGVIEEFRANGGTAGGMFAGRELLLLTTTGARSGERRTIPLLYFRDGDRIFVIASQGGAPTHPGWHHNLVVTPEATIEVGAERYPVRATFTSGAERDRLFAYAVGQDRRIGESQEKTSRVIPVVILDRVR